MGLIGGSVDGRVWVLLVGTAEGRVWVLLVGQLMVGCGSYWWVS